MYYYLGGKNPIANNNVVWKITIMLKKRFAPRQHQQKESKREHSPSRWLLRGPGTACVHRLRWARSKIRHPSLCHTPAGRRHRRPPGWYAPKIFICGEIISGYNSSYFPGKGWTCPLRWLVPGAEGTFSENWLHFSRKNQPSIPLEPHQRRPECISSIPSPQVLANQLINALTITRVSVHSRCVWGRYLVSSFWIWLRWAASKTKAAHLPSQDKQCSAFDSCLCNYG